MKFPLEMLKVIAEGADEVQGAANGFGQLLACTIRIAPEHEDDPALIMRYAYADQGWSVEFLPTPTTGEE
jgi:hypothetical protein